MKIVLRLVCICVIGGVIALSIRQFNKAKPVKELSKENVVYSKDTDPSVPWANTLLNPDKFTNELSEKLRANPQDEEAFASLEKAAKSPDEFNRTNAYAYIRQMATAAPDSANEKFIPLLKTGLNDPEQSVRREAVSAAMECGSQAVSALQDKLEQIVNASGEFDVVWFSAEALGKLTDEKAIKKTIPVLVKAAKTNPSLSVKNQGPLLRESALLALMELSEYDKEGAQAALKEVAASSQGEFLDLVNEKISELNGVKP